MVLISSSALADRVKYVGIKKIQNFQLDKMKPNSREMGRILFYHVSSSILHEDSTTWSIASIIIKDKMTGRRCDRLKSFEIIANILGK